MVMSGIPRGRPPQSGPRRIGQIMPWSRGMMPLLPTRLSLGQIRVCRPAWFARTSFRPSGLLLTALVTAGCFAGFAAAAELLRQQGCVVAPKSPLVVNVRDKGAKGDGRTDDTEAIQAAIDEVGGTGGTVLVPRGTYMVDAVKKKRRLCAQERHDAEARQGCGPQGDPQRLRANMPCFRFRTCRTSPLWAERSKATAPSKG